MHGRGPVATGKSPRWSAPSPLHSLSTIRTTTAVRELASQAHTCVSVIRRHPGAVVLRRRGVRSSSHQGPHPISDARGTVSSPSRRLAISVYIYHAHPRAERNAPPFAAHSVLPLTYSTYKPHLPPFSLGLPRTCRSSTSSSSSFAAKKHRFLPAGSPFPKQQPSPSPTSNDTTSTTNHKPHHHPP